MWCPAGPRFVELAEEESERLMNLEGILHERVVGQEEAVTAISRPSAEGRVGP